MKNTLQFRRKQAIVIQRPALAPWGTMSRGGFVTRRIWCQWVALELNKPQQCDRGNLARALFPGSFKYNLLLLLLDRFLTLFAGSNGILEKYFASPVKMNEKILVFQVRSSPSESFFSQSQLYPVGNPSGFFHLCKASRAWAPQS